MHKVEWICPPRSLKLNFNGIFLGSTSQGGIGGVIRNCNRDVVRNYSGPVDSMDANEAEVYDALLIGCRESDKIGGSHPIFEGNFINSMGIRELYLSLEDYGLGGGSARFI